MRLLSELRSLSAPELSQRLTQWRQELRDVRLKAAQGNVEQPHRIRQLRRNIARALTLQGQQQTTQVRG